MRNRTNIHSVTQTLGIMSQTTMLQCRTYKLSVTLILKYDILLKLGMWLAYNIQFYVLLIEVARYFISSAKPVCIKHSITTFGTDTGILWTLMIHYTGILHLTVSFSIVGFSLNQYLLLYVTTWPFRWN